MPLQKLQYRPGVYREGTDYSNEGGFYDGDKVRFRSGLPEKIGGWIQVAAKQFLGFCRALWTWTALNAANYIGVGTQLKYYIYSGGNYYDITPITQTDSLSNPITANTSTPSAKLTIVDGSNTANVGDYIIISGATSLGGNMTAAILNQEYVITAINPSTNSYNVIAYSSQVQAGSFVVGTVYTIQYVGTTNFTLIGANSNALGTIFTATGAGTGTGIAGTPVYSTSSDTGQGGTVTIQYELPVGLAVASVSNGWGTGPWGGANGSSLVNLNNPFTTTNGSGVITVTQANHGLTTGNSVFFQTVTNPVGGIPAILLQQAFVVTVVNTNSYTINISPITTSDSSTFGSGATSITVSASDAMNIYPNMLVIGTNVPSGTTVSSLYVTGSTTVPINGLTTGASSGTYTYTYYDYTTITAGTGVGGAVTVVVPNTPNRGWGTSYNSNTATGFTTQLRLWSNDNFGQDLVINPRGGGIYYWQAANGVGTRAIPLQTLTKSQVSAVTTATFASSASSITVANATGIYPGSYIISGVGITAGTYVLSSYVIGSTTVPISTTTTASSSGNYTFSYSATAVPTNANYVLTSSIQQFVIAFGTQFYGSTTQNPMVVRWSDQGNPYQWTPQVTNQSGDFTLTNGSYIMTAQTTRVETLVWTDSCLYTMQYIGYPYVFSFNVLMDNITIISPNAAITVNNVTYWMGRDKFYKYTGVVSTLPCALRQYIFDDINLTQSYQVFAGSNEGFNEVWWFYVSNESVGLQIDKYVIYNYLDNVWSYGTMARTAWLQYGIEPEPIAADYNSRLLYHEVGTDDVSTSNPVPIRSYIQSSNFGIEAGEHFGFVWRMLPDINFNGSTVNNPSVTMTLYGRANSGAAPVGSDIDTVTSANNYSSQSEYTVQQFTGEVYTRLRARQIAFKIQSTDLGVAWQLGTPRADIKPGGRR